MKSDDTPERRGIRASTDSPDFILEFDTSSSEFGRGFECGEIWACLTDKVAQITALICAENTEMVIRMAEATGYKYQARMLDQQEVDNLHLGSGDWMVVVMSHDDE